MAKSQKQKWPQNPSEQPKSDHFQSLISRPDSLSIPIFP